MLIEEYERLPKLTEEEVRKQAEGIFNFLKLTHPYINNKKIFYKSGRAIEEQINFDSEMCIRDRYTPIPTRICERSIWQLYKRAWNWNYEVSWYEWEGLWEWQ